jgi:hypothetical protein
MNDRRQRLMNALQWAMDVFAGITFAGICVGVILYAAQGVLCR